MRSEPGRSVEDLLDACIEQLLAGQGWNDIVPPDHPYYQEIEALMETVQALMNLGRSTAVTEGETLAERAKVWEVLQHTMSTQ